MAHLVQSDRSWQLCGPGVLAVGGRQVQGWDAYQVGITVGVPPASRTGTIAVSPPPLYDDQLPYGGNIISPPNGSHWVLIGDGSFRAGPPPAEADCQGMLARSQAAIVGNKVTTYFRRTTVCATKFDKLTKAPVRPRLLGLFPSLWMSQVSVRLPVPLG